MFTHLNPVLQIHRISDLRIKCCDLFGATNWFNDVILTS